MLNSIRVPIVAGIAFTIVSACGGSNAPADLPGSPPATDIPATTSAPRATNTDAPVLIGDALWPIARGDSAKALVAGQDAVIIGTIKKVAVPYDPRSGYLGVPTPSVSDQQSNPHKPNSTPTPEELSRPPGRDFTIFEVVVERSFGPEALRQGDVIYVAQAGGIWEGKVSQLEGYPLFQLDASYFLTLDRSETVSGLAGSEAAYFTGVPFAQYLVDDSGRLQSLDDMWKDLPAVQEMSGKTATEVGQLISTSQ